MNNSEKPSMIAIIGQEVGQILTTRFVRSEPTSEGK